MFVVDNFSISDYMSRHKQKTCLSCRFIVNVQVVKFSRGQIRRSFLFLSTDMFFYGNEICEKKWTAAAENTRIPTSKPFNHHSFF